MLLIVIKWLAFKLIETMESELKTEGGEGGCWHRWSERWIISWGRPTYFHPQYAIIIDWRLAKDLPSATGFILGRTPSSVQPQTATRLTRPLRLPHRTSISITPSHPHWNPHSLINCGRFGPATLPLFVGRLEVKHGSRRKTENFGVQWMRRPLQNCGRVKRAWRWRRTKRNGNGGGTKMLDESVGMDCKCGRWWWWWRLGWVGGRRAHNRKPICLMSSKSQLDKECELRTL